MTAVPSVDPSDLAEVTVRLESTTTQHQWLQYEDEPIAVYNYYDCLGTALAKPGLDALLTQAGNLAYYKRWFAETVPMALDIQRRGFGHLDRARLAAYKATLAEQLGAIDAKILAQVSLFQELRDEVEAWRAADEAADYAAARQKLQAKIEAAVIKLDAAKTPKAAERWAAKIRELEDTPLAPTKETSRAKRYASKLAAIDGPKGVRAKFLNSRGENGRLATWLFGEMRFKPAPKAHKRPARSTAKAALMFIYTHLRKMDGPNKWILEDLFHRSRLNTIRSRYLHFPTGRDGRVYPRLRLYSAETFRWAYSDPPLHQWPPEIRHLIVPRPGHVFVAADYSQLEARIMAYLAWEERDIAAFEDPARDVHIETAMDIYGVPHRMSADAVTELRRHHAAGLKHTDAYAEVFPGWQELGKPARKGQRDGGKKKRYETLYGASAMGAAAQQLFCPCPRCSDKVPQTMNLTPAQNRSIAQRWAVTREKTMRWRENLFNNAVANGRKVVTPWGYTRRFAAPAQDMRNPCYNVLMQSGAAEIINRAAYSLYKQHLPIVLQMHDELILEVPVDQLDATKAAMRAAMEQPIPELGGAVFPVDIHHGYDWGALK